MTLLGLACLGFAMLIWLKLRVVTGVPRTAYADPEDTAKSPAASLHQPHRSR